MSFKSRNNKLWERVVRRLCASPGCQGELAAEGERGAPNSAEGGEESLRCACLPLGGAAHRHAGVGTAGGFTAEYAVKNEGIPNNLDDTN